jgi:transcription initiation factor IIE alpha subunit
MTRTYALKKLLEHGELSSKEIEEITCWTTKQVWAGIQRLQKTNTVRKYPQMKWGLIQLWPYP